MKIGIVGGVERNETAYQTLAESAGHEVLFHGGHVAGRGTEKLIELVRGVDLILVMTDVNSHGAVGVARKAATRFGKPLALFRRLGPARFSAELPSLGLLAASRREVA